MVNNIRGLTRPIIAIWFAVVSSGLVGYDLVVNHVSLPLWYQVMIAGSIGWWFFERSKKGGATP